MGERYASETGMYRDALIAYCVGNGIEIGAAGDPIVPRAVTIDTSETGYANCGDHPVNLVGDGRNLFWFRDNVMDYVYSSHVLEDFENTRDVMREWIRVVKPGGRLVLLLPDQQRYLAHCKASGQPLNHGHKHAHFGLSYLKSLLPGLGSVEAEIPSLGPYSFGIVIRKS